jgi:hypothetical protein
MCDDYTKNVIIDYLHLDNFELVKNIAWTVNKENASEVINFKDWALARNYATIKLLEDSIDKRKEFNDKLVWEMKKLKS